ncbi:MAG: hypothetical protein J6M19_00935 [Bacteroidaceae bacterium]|nr:hypothetical protein [Bacteroidaceae bacterium]
MKLKHLLLYGALLLGCINASATIVDGVRQKPTYEYETTGFVTDTEVYLYNVGSGLFFTNGNAFGTQASVGETPLLVRFTETGGGDYFFQDYFRNGWMYTFFQSETTMYVDRAEQANYFFAVEDNGSTFRLSTSSRNPSFSDYAGAGLYVGVMKNSASTALTPFVDADDAYVDWSILTVENYEALAEQVALYNKAQELKGWIDKINAQNGNASSLESVYLDESSTMEQLQAAINSASALYIKAVVDNAPDKENIDLTMALVNPMLEEGTTGWTNGSTVTVAGLPTNKCMEAWNKASFDVYQELADMPVGVYEIEVQGFYRYLRDAAAWNAYKAQSVEYVKPEGVPVYVYLNNNSTPFKNIYSEPVPYGTLYTTDASLLYPSALPPCEDDKGNWYPNEMYNSAVAFNAGMYKQTAYGLIANEGDAFRIGVKGTSNQGNDSWVIWDNFKLYYRGFKAEVVQPILETAMADLNQYAGLLMGKTEYAALSKALTDAQTAIDQQNGENMFQALNDLYDVKESVIASKDLFLAQEVPADLANLQNAITDLANARMSVATRAAATTLETGIKGNTLYEGTEINQLKSDVNATISNLNNSVSLYSQLNDAISSLEAATALKANQALLDEAATLIESAKAGYNDGSIADGEVGEMVDDLYDKATAINNSATAYASLATAITNLQNAIAEASTTEARVAKSTLTKANLRLTASQNLYDNGTIADVDIEDRVTTIGQLIEELTRSTRLYEEFKQALDELNTALATTEPMSAATRSAAQSVYETALAAYNEGTVDDDQIEAQKGALNAQIEAINNSVSKYAELAEAFERLQPVVGKKALQTLMDEVDELNAKQADYENGAIADEDIDGIISAIDAIIPQVNASAEKYAELAAAITRLEEGIAVASTDEARVAKSTLTKANLRLTASKNLYDNGTIADVDIDARVTTIDQLVDELTHSILLYQEFNTALESLKTTLEENEETPMSAATRAAAQSVYETALAAYNEGTVDDDQIEAQKNALNAQIAAINASVGLYAGLPAPLAQLETALGQKAAQSVIDAATTVFNDAKDGYDARSIADADVENTIASINAQTSALNTSASQYAQFNTAIGNLQAAITTAQEEGRVSVSMLTNANSKCADYQTGYENGEEDNVPTAIAGINNIIANLSAAAPLYPQASGLTADLTTLGTKLDEADEAIAVAEDVLAQYISSDLREELESAVAEYKETVAAAKTDKGTMESQLAGRQLDLTNSESALTEDNAALYSAIGADFNTMSGDIAALIRSLSGIKTTLDEKTENAVEESANKVEIAHNIATFCSMKDLDFTTVEEVRAYIVSTFTPSTGDAILTRIYDVPAGTGVVLIGDNGNYEIPAGTGSTVVSNLLVGVNRATVLNQVDGDYTNFILTNGESGEGFYPVEDGSTLAAGKAYLPLPTASLPASGIGNGAAIRFVFEDSGEATYINGLGFGYAGSKMEKGVYYNLNGQRVGRPVTGGIYILDGKKILVK